MYCPVPTTRQFGNCHVIQLVKYILKLDAKLCFILDENGSKLKRIQAAIRKNTFIRRYRFVCIFFTSAMILQQSRSTSFWVYFFHFFRLAFLSFFRGNPLDNQNRYFKRSRIYPNRKTVPSFFSDLPRRSTNTPFFPVGSLINCACSMPEFAIPALKLTDSLILS